MTFVIAPAGYGKSTLLRQAESRLRDVGNNVAWLNCDESDRVAENFLRNIRQAITIHNSDFAGCKLTLSTITEGIEKDIKENNRGFVIVIDDYEKIEGSQADTIVDALASMAPPKFRILIAARTFDIAMIARFQIEGLARVIDAAALRFNREETEQLLQDRCTQETIERVFEISEGWPMTVQLACVKAGRPGANVNFIDTLVRPHSEVFGFLAEEIVSSLPVEQTQLLTACSIVDYIDRDIAHALTGNDKAEALIAAASMLDPLVSVQPGSTLTIKLHPLLREFLSLSLSEHGAQKIAALQDCAARYYADAGDIFRAIQHALSAQDSSLAATIFEKVGGPLAILNHGPANVWSYLNQMPRPIIDQRPALSATRILNHIIEGDGLLTLQDKKKFSIIGQPDSGSDALNNEELQQLVDFSSCVLIDACTPINRYLDKEAPHFEVAMRRKAPHDPRVLGIFLPLRFFLEYRYGSIETARAICTEYETLCNDNAYAEQLPSISPHLGMLAYAEGDVDSAELFFSDNLTHLWDRFVGREELLAKVGRSLLAKIYIEQNRIEDALMNIQAVGEFIETTFIELIEANDISYPRGCSYRGDTLRALDHLEMTRRRRALYGLDNAIRAIDATRVEILVKSGDVDGALSLARLTQLDKAWEFEIGHQHWNWSFIDCYIRAITGLHLATGDHDRLLDIANVVRNKAISTARILTTALADIAAAAAYYAGGEEENAGKHLKNALRSHIRPGFIRPYFDLAPGIAPALEEIRNDKSTSEESKKHVNRILSLWDLSIRSGTLQNVLTRRESDVLVELSKGLSTKIIAQHLGVAPETVKHHLKNIFTKLGVDSRKAAVSEAYRRIQ